MLQRLLIASAAAVICCAAAPIACAALPAATPPAPYTTLSGGAKWPMASIWNDGQAEVCAYQATESRYGGPREFTAYFIVSAEELRSDTLVKIEKSRPGVIPMRVLKINQVYDIPAGLSGDRQMVTVFLRRSDFAPVKESVTSQDWNGNAFFLLLNRDGKGTLRGFTYFEGESEREQTIDLSGATIYDALPLAIRSIPFGYGLERKILVGSPLLRNRNTPMKVAEALMLVQGIEKVATPLGAIDGWRVDLQHPGGLDQFWIEREPPNRLLQWNKADGGRYLLKASKRLAYGTLHDPGDADALFRSDSPSGAAPPSGP